MQSTTLIKRKGMTVLLRYRGDRAGGIQEPINENPCFLMFCGTSSSRHSGTRPMKALRGMVHLWLNIAA
jgi:hypothetical protein